MPTDDDEKYFKFEMYDVLVETDKAIRIKSFTKDGDFEELWLPKSQIAFNGDSKYGGEELWASLWLVRKKEEELDLEFQGSEI